MEYFNETDRSHSLPGPNDTDDIEKVTHWFKGQGHPMMAADIL